MSLFGTSRRQFARHLDEVLAHEELRAGEEKALYRKLDRIVSRFESKLDSRLISRLRSERMAAEKAAREQEQRAREMAGKI